MSTYLVFNSSFFLKNDELNIYFFVSILNDVTIDLLSHLLLFVYYFVFNLSTSFIFNRCHTDVTQVSHHNLNNLVCDGAVTVL